MTSSVHVVILKKKIADCELIACCNDLEKAKEIAIEFFAGNKHYNFHETQVEKIQRGTSVEIIRIPMGENVHEKLFQQDVGIGIFPRAILNGEMVDGQFKPRWSAHKLYREDGELYYGVFPVDFLDDKTLDIS